MKHLFAFLAFFAFAVLSYSSEEKFSETHPFEPSGEIVLSNTNGDITIRTWDRLEVKIEGEKQATTDEELKLLGLTIDATPSLMTIKTKFPKRPGSFFGSQIIRAHVTFTLTVPANARLRKIETVNGSVAIEGVGGTVDAESVNGRITAEGLRADTTLETVNGTIHAAFTLIAPQQKISVQTVNGSATVTLPKSASLVLSAKTVNGGINCEFPLREDGKQSRHHVRGTIGDGAASLEAKTVNGGIKVKQL